MRSIHPPSMRDHTENSVGPQHRFSTDALVWIVIAIAVTLFWLVSTSWRPWNLFDRAGFSADFYDEQARSFIRGRLAVRPEVPGPEGFLIDGQTYLYYGPLLAIVRIPFALFGELFVARLVRISMLIALVVLGRWAARLARAGRRVVTERPATGDTVVEPAEVPADRWPVALFTAAVLFSPALFAAGWITVYHETELWALTWAVVTLTLLAEWAAGGFTDRSILMLAALAALATTLTRAPIGLGLAFGLGCIGLVLAWRSRANGGRLGWLAIGGGVAPLAIYTLINWVKFGTWLSVPGDRQRLTLDDPVRTAFFEATRGSFFDVRFLPTTVIQYLRPDTIRFERLVPGIRFGPLAENRGSIDVETVTPASSLVVSATLLVLLALVGLWSLVRRRARTWLVLVGAGMLGAVPSLLIGFVANRYLIDMLPPLIVAAAAGVWVVASSDRRRVVLVGGSVLVVWGAWVNAALATWTLELKSPGFTELRSDVDAAVFDGGDVGIVDAIPGGPVPRDGLIGLSAACSGVYIAEQGRWVALDRADGAFRVDGRIDELSDDPVRLADNDVWAVEASTSATGGVEIVYASALDPSSFILDVAAQAPFDFTVVVDPITRESYIEIDGRLSFLPGEAVNHVTAAEGISAAPPDASIAPSELCVELDSRR